ncbi:glycoside hydrolase family 26 protein, partial [Cellulomonas massiliensis]|uniref:glycoside hydrolase family 26 protein n=1 Tax=Cellulomonas massiliensis TaxID=1465811 RepID=UPI00036F6F0D
MSDRLSLVAASRGARWAALALSLALGVVTLVVWLSPASDSEAQGTAHEQALQRQIDQLEADLASTQHTLDARRTELAALQASNAKAARERAEGQARGEAKAAAEKQAAQERGAAKAQAERDAAAQQGREQAAEQRAVAAERGQQKAAWERAAAAEVGRAKAAAAREAARAAEEAGRTKARLEKDVAAADGRAKGAAERERSARDLVEKLKQDLRDATNPKPVKPTAPPLSELLAPTKRQFGLYTTQSPFNWAELDDVAAKVGAKPTMAGYFQGWDGDFRADAVNRSWTKGMLPLLTWESRPLKSGNDQPTDPDYSLPVIIDGKYDDYLHRYARDVVKNGLPLAIRLDHEMNGSWYPWGERTWGGGPLNGNGKGDFVKMWRHVHDIFEEEGANQYVIWIWAPNIVNALPDYAKWSSWYMKSLYPGDEYVDWVGLSGYYRPPYRSDQTPTFEYTYDASLDQLREITDKPILLAEIGASEIGGRKPQWVSSLFEGLAKPENADVIGFAWFHHTVTTISGGERVTNDWRIDSRRDSLQAFVDGLHDPALGFLTDGSRSRAALPASPTTSPVATPAPSPTAPSPTATATPQATGVPRGPGTTATPSPTPTASPPPDEAAEPAAT